jgi:hypothetical protein
MYVAQRDRHKCDAAHRNRLCTDIYSMQVIAWLIAASACDHLSFGIDGGRYVVISAISNAITLADMVAGVERGVRLRAPAGGL